MRPESLSCVRGKLLLIIQLLFRRHRKQIFSAILALFDFAFFQQNSYNFILNLLLGHLFYPLRKFEIVINYFYNFASFPHLSSFPVMLYALLNCRNAAFRESAVAPLFITLSNVQIGITPA